MITIKDLSKKFGNKQILSNVNLTFELGKIYGIVGENGAGKSTLFRCIAGLEAHAGEVVSSMVPLKNHLGFLMTDPYFFDKITGREYIQLLCNARHVKMGNMADKNIFDLPLDQYASTYSTGMKKKLALTAILLQENDYFILDEPFNGVDIQSNIIITALIQKLGQLNKTVIISSHIFSTLNDTCDEIHLLSSGRITDSVLQADFDLLEAKMKVGVIGDKIKKFGL
jgi:ABC-2 type transport system ATP-binding protein